MTSHLPDDFDSWNVQLSCTLDILGLDYQRKASSDMVVQQEISWLIGLTPMGMSRDVNDCVCMYHV